MGCDGQCCGFCKPDTYQVVPTLTEAPADYIIPYRTLGLKPDADGKYHVLPFVDGDDE